MRITLGILLIAVGLVGAYYILSGKILQPSSSAGSNGSSRDFGQTGPGSAAEKSSPNKLKVPGGTIYGSGGDMFASLGGMH